MAATKQDIGPVLEPMRGVVHSRSPEAAAQRQATPYGGLSRFRQSVTLLAGEFRSQYKKNSNPVLPLVTRALKCGEPTPSRGAPLPKPQHQVGFGLAAAEVGPPWSNWYTASRSWRNSSTNRSQRLLSTNSCRISAGTGFIASKQLLTDLRGAFQENQADTAMGRARDRGEINYKCKKKRPQKISWGFRRFACYLPTPPGAKPVSHSGKKKESGLANEKVTI